LLDLAEVKQVDKEQLKAFLAEDHTAFSALSVATKHIESTNRIAVSLTKNQASCFYLGKKKVKPKPKQPQVNDDCLKDAQNCQYFKFFNSKEKKLYTRFSDNFEANFWGKFCDCPKEIKCSHPCLFATGTYNTSCEELYAWTTNWDPADPCWNSLEGKKVYDLQEWAQQFDPHCETLKVYLPPTVEDPAQFTTIKKHIAKLIRDINRLFKPNNWRWALIFELQKNGHWH